jgi:hypothetical protein
MGKSNISKKSFERRKDFEFFLMLYKKLDSKEITENFLVCNYVYSNYNIIELASPDAMELYNRWNSKMQGFMSYHFKNDILHLRNIDVNYLEIPEKCYPIILSEIFKKNVNLETLIVLEKYNKVNTQEYKEKYDDIIFNKFYAKYKPYYDFFKNNALLSIQK